MIKTRFAPSPTGELHIGGARTALFAYLFAKSEGGEFLLRIEDTDRERFVEGSVERIIESMKWLKIIPDNINEPFIQSKRLEYYKEAALKLIETNNAYVCECSKGRLEKLRKKNSELSKYALNYDGKCRREGLGYQKGCVVRMKIPESRVISVEDDIRGEIEFNASIIDDQIILKSDGYPTYHLASVIDDHEMGITHVIRAEEWLSSTPKHIILYEMFEKVLGWDKEDRPRFAHLPMILGPDKKKLSKRHGATSVEEYQKRGYLSEAIFNFMLFMGWNPKDDSQHYFNIETFTSNISDMKRDFKLKDVNKSAAMFDVAKLDDYNEFYTRSKPITKLKELLVDFGLDDINSGETEIVKRGGYKTLKEAAEHILKLRKTPEYDSTILIFKKSNKEKTKKGMQYTVESIQGSEDWTADNLQIVLSKVVEETGLENGDVYWPIRVALSGEERSPSPVELMLALGKEESIKRIKVGLDKLA